MMPCGCPWLYHVAASSVLHWKWKPSRSRGTWSGGVNLQLVVVQSVLRWGTFFGMLWCPHCMSCVGLLRGTIKSDQGTTSWQWWSGVAESIGGGLDALWDLELEVVQEIMDTHTWRCTLWGHHWMPLWACPGIEQVKTISKGGNAGCKPACTYVCMWVFLYTSEVACCNMFITRQYAKGSDTDCMTLESVGWRTSHATARKWVYWLETRWTAQSAQLWTIKQDYFRNGCLYGREDGRRWWKYVRLQSYTDWWHFSVNILPPTIRRYIWKKVECGQIWSCDFRAKLAQKTSICPNLPWQKRHIWQ